MKFLPFIGVIENMLDPLEIGRAQVRIYHHHTQSVGELPTEYLPWFTLGGNNSSGVQGIGTTPTDYIEGSTVVGFCFDEEMNQGVVLCSITGIPSSPDINRLARGVTHQLANLREQGRIKGGQLPFNQGEWEEPAFSNKSVYPMNKVYESKSGHVREYDDTPGNERIHEYHRSGTYYEVSAGGDRVVKVVGDGYEIIAGGKNTIIKGTCNLTIEGNVNQYVKGDYNLQVDGNKTEVIMGDVKEFYAEHRTEVQGTHSVQASTIKHNE